MQNKSYLKYELWHQIIKQTLMNENDEVGALKYEAWWQIKQLDSKREFRESQNTLKSRVKST